MTHYKALYQAINKGLVGSCHDCSDGGLAVALAEKGFGGGLGLNVNLSDVPCFEVDTDLEILFSESASRLIVSINPIHAQTFEQSMKSCIVKRIGEVREDQRFIIRGLSGKVIIDEDIHALKTSWQTGFKLKRSFMPKIKALILTGYGINCEKEMFLACKTAGAEPVFVHTSVFMERSFSLNPYQFLLFSGGFSFGDELGAGKVFANMLSSSLHLKEKLLKFAEQGGCLLGICNGFQILVKLGFLPGISGLGMTQEASLTTNEHRSFENRWVDHKICDSQCVFTQGIDQLYLPIRHGEGKFVAKDTATLQKLYKNKQVALQYIQNPNGSLNDIAGICDPTGRILGMMAHPEAALFFTQLPNWTRIKEERIRKGEPLPLYGPGYKLFQNVIKYLEQN